MDNDSASNATNASGSKRSFEDDDNDTSASKKCRTYTKGDEEGVAATAMIASLTESLQNCEDNLASCQSELESAKAEIDKWNSAFKKKSFVPSEKSPEPEFVIDYIKTLTSSDKSLKEELEIAQMKLAIHDLKSQLKPEETHEDHEQNGPDTASLKALAEDQSRLIQTQSSHIEMLNSRIETQNSHIKRYDVVVDYLAAKVPRFAAFLRTNTLAPNNDQSGTGNDQAGNNDSNNV